MSRSTEPRPPRRRGVTLALAAVLVVLPIGMLAPPAAAAGTWTIGGTIANWDSTLVGTDVEVYYDDGSGTPQLIDIFTLAIDNPAFTSDPLDADPAGSAPAGEYTLYFDVSSSVEYIDGFLGGKLFEEYPDVTWLTADSVADVDAGTFDLIQAQYISGTVTGAGSPVDGATIYADDEGIVDATGFLMQDPFTAQSDSLGEYSLKVAAGRTYIVSVEHPDWPSQTYLDHDGCGCSTPYDPVATLPPPASARTGIDFHLVLPVALIFGIVLGGDLDATTYPVADIDAHLYRPVPGGWVEVGTTATDPGGAWQQYLTETGPYRIRFSYFGEWVHIFQSYSGLQSDPPVDYEVLDGCFIDTGDIPEHDIYAAIVTVDDPLVVTGCGPEPAPSQGGGSSGTSTPTRPRTASSSAFTVVEPAATPSPSATPSASASPRPSASPTPSATPAAEPTPASGPDLWWLLWVILAIVVIVTVAGVVSFIRRR